LGETLAGVDRRDGHVVEVGCCCRLEGECDRGRRLREAGGPWVVCSRRMADRTDLDFTYSLTDRIIRLSLGELPDFSGAMFDGDFALSR
jgi:hypothetical protein